MPQASFLINTTIGIIGLANPAEKLGLKAQKEDVGQTLGAYGVGPGCYFVLPIFGTYHCKRYCWHVC